MPNVVNLQERAPRSRGREVQRRFENEGADVAEPASCSNRLQSRAREEIDAAVLMLDLAARHARLIEPRMCDPITKRDFDTHITAIERLIQITREMALKL